jgi:hypothetical protein
MNPRVGTNRPPGIMHVRFGNDVVKLQDVVKLPALALVARVAVGKTVGYWLSCS